MSFPWRELRSADKIVMIHQGKIVEKGSQVELMKAKGMYFQLIMTQLNKNPLENEAEAEFNELEESLDKSLDTLKSGEGLVSQMFERAVSMTQQVKKGQQEEDGESGGVGLGAMMTIVAPDWHYILLGVLGCAGSAAGLQVFFVLYGGVLQSLGEQVQEARFHADFFAILLAIQSLITGIVPSLPSKHYK